MATIVTITGPSCSGKTTLASYLTSRGIPEIQSFTTRAPREGEKVDGTGNYNFVTREWVEEYPKDQMIEKVVFNGNLYGNTVEQMEQAFMKSVRKPAMACVVVEPDGVSHWHEAASRLGFKVYSIFLAQSPTTIMKRYADRIAKVKEEQIESELARIEHAIYTEIPVWESLWDYDLIVRDLGTPKETVSMEMIAGHLLLGQAA